MPFCAYCGTPVNAISSAPCPSCGNPTSGAPRPAPPPGGSNAAVIVVVVIGGLLIVVAIVGILAAIAIPNLLTATQRSKQKRTMADLRTVATALEAYATDHNRYPEATDVSSLNSALVPTYIRVVPGNDGWAHPMRYSAWSSDGARVNSYAVASGGKDGSFSHESLHEYEGGATTNFNDDIVFSNGHFVQYPQGAQQ